MRITAPVSGWCGRIGDVVFTDGVADTDDHAVLTYCRDLGYRIGDTDPSLEIAVAGNPAGDEIAPEPVEPSKADLIAQAEALGVKVDARWGVQRLTDEIAAANT